MHVVGVVREGNQSVELDVRLQGQQGVALIHTKGATVRVVKVGSHVYVQGDDTFYEQLGGAEMARLLTGKWLKGSPAVIRRSLDRLLVGGLARAPYHGKLRRPATRHLYGAR